MTGLNDDDAVAQLSCAACREMIKAWLDGELEPIRAAAVERHNGACAACREVADDFREIASLVRSSGEDQALRLRSSGAARRVASEAIVRARWAVREEVRFVSLLQRVASAAAAVLVITLGLHMFSGGFGTNGDTVGSLDNVLELAISDPTWKEDF